MLELRQFLVPEENQHCRQLEELAVYSLRRKQIARCRFAQRRADGDSSMAYFTSFHGTILDGRVLM